MYEYVVVTLTAAISGFIGVFLAEGLRTADHWDEVPNFKAWLRPVWPAAIINMVGGGMASLGLWATYTGGLSLDSMHVTPSELGASLFVGLGGAGALSGYLQVRGSARKWEKIAKKDLDTIDDLGDAVNDAIDDTAEDPHTRIGGTTNDSDDAPPNDHS